MQEKKDKSSVEKPILQEMVVLGNHCGCSLCYLW